MIHPVQRIHAHTASDRVYTATSNVLHVFRSSTGELLSTWTAPLVPNPNIPAQSSTSAASPPPESASEQSPAPPGSPAGPVAGSKKRKLGEQAGENKKLRASKWVNTMGGCNNAITNIKTTEDGRWVTVATTEDKAIRVFRASIGTEEGGLLELLSTRALPKRVGDFAILNEDTILAGDKHGDVFALPLQERASSAPKSAPTPHAQIPHDVREAAAAEKRKRTEIDYALPFTHRFVLGHVSMLLRILPITVGKRTWIVTGDRDEHIRVTRWPDSFVIDGFLLRHEGFVSSLLCPSWREERDWLVSAGGDEYFIVWKWMDRKVSQMVQLREAVEAAFPALTAPEPAAESEETGEENKEEKRIVVNGLWEVPGGIMIGIERAPILLFYNTTPEDPDTLVLASTLKLPGNVLDLTVFDNEPKMLVAVDSETSSELVTAWRYDAEKNEWIAAEDKVVEKVKEEVTKVEMPEDMKDVVKNNVLYTVATLRKTFREGEDTRNRDARRAGQGEEGEEQAEGKEDEMEE